ncbi:MAG: sulfatase family protein [Vicinamibacteria bacterium]
MKARFAALLLASILFACRAAEPPPTHAGINVLLLTIDTLRADHLSGYGYARQTSPAMDGLAARGVLFENAFTYWPKTRGSLAAMFTSLYAAQHGLTVRERDLPDYNQTLAETLKASGYQTAAAVDNGNLDRELGFAQGFDRYEQVWLTADTEVERTEQLTRFAIHFIESYQQAEPFFLWIHYVNPHTPYEPPEELLDLFRGDEIIPRGPKLEPVVGYQGGVNRHLPLAGESYWGDYVDRYDAEIAFADRHIGHVLEALDKSPHNGSTLVVLTSDHGESLGEHDYYFDHGFDLFDPSLRVPLVLSFPGILPQGEIVQAAVSTLDIFPSILDLAQITFPSGLQGRSLLPLVRHSEDRLHDRIFFQNDQHLLGISDGRLKLISYPGTGQGEGHFELYDTRRDPYELNDRYRESQEAVSPLEAELSSFRTRTVAWQQETDRRRQGAPARGDAELSEKTIRNLEALGYLGNKKD